ncbi:hypothetical protein TNCV_3496121 [Trichonephila clavipes]|nr:hypothetical protein TNCV_3496121 [Trichonephila clavipes]
MMDSIVAERKSLEVEAIKEIELEDLCLAEHRAFELEKLKLQAKIFQRSKNHFLDAWEKLNDPIMLAEKLDSYKNVKPSQKFTKFPKPRELNKARFSRNTDNPEFRKSHSFKVEKNISGNHNRVHLLTLTTCQHEIPTLVVIHLLLAIVVSTLNL